MEHFYLQACSGGLLGPITRSAVEVLFDARLIDERTPISNDGASFSPLGGHLLLLEHLQEVKARLVQGEPVWGDDFVFAPAPQSLADSPVVRTAARWLVEVAASGSSGVLRTPQGLQLSFRGGRLLKVELERGLGFEDWLMAKGTQAVRAALQDIAAYGHDVGAAVIATGAMAPDDFLQAWRRWSLERVADFMILTVAEEIEFEEKEIAQPPLALDVPPFSLPFAAARCLPVEVLQGRLCDDLDRLVIPSQVEGLDTDVLKMKPKELKAFRAVNGARTVGEILGDGNATEDALRMLFVCVETGLSVLGDDHAQTQQVSETAGAKAWLSRYENANPLEVLGVSPSDTDKLVRERFVELASEFHGDRLPPEASDELRQLHQQISSCLNAAFEEADTASKRMALAPPTKENEPADPEEDARKAEEARKRDEAEVHFKRAEIMHDVKNFKACLDHLKAAIELNPEHHEAQMLRSFVSYRQLEREGRGAEIAKKTAGELRMLIKQAPRTVNGFYWLGLMERILGQDEKADRNFGRALRIDPNHAGAMREVRLANQRRERTKTHWPSLSALRSAIPTDTK